MKAMPGVSSSDVTMRVGLKRMVMGNVETYTPVTIGSGSLQLPNSSKPYYYGGYFYAFYLSGGTLYYATSADGLTWAATSIATCGYRWATMGIDDKILLLRVVDNYFKVCVGTIESDHTITWGVDINLGTQKSYNRSGWCYATKISGARKLVVNVIEWSGTVINAQAAIYVSDDDGDSWFSLGACIVPRWTALWWRQFQVIPFDDGNKVQEIHAPYTVPIETDTLYRISGIYRDGAVCSTQVLIGPFRNRYYLDDQANAILIGNYVHLVYIDQSSNLLHVRVAEDGTWETVGTVKTGIGVDAGLTLCYDSSTQKLHIITYEGTTIKRVIWNGVLYSAEENLIEGEADIKQLTSHPSPLNNKIPLVWQDGTNVRFALVRK